jgi:aminoglycoside phosphotransferase (APT) family kinase protein
MSAANAGLHMHADTAAALTQYIAHRAGCRPADIALAPIATGKFNDSFFVTAGQRRLVLRIAPADEMFCLFYERNMMMQEPGIHALLLQRTAIPVAPVIACDRSREIIDRDFLLMERLPGAALSETACADTDAVMRAVGRCLRQSHALRADAFGYLGEHRPMQPQSSWFDAFRIMWRLLLDDIVASGHYSASDAARLRDLLDKHAQAFDRPVAAGLLHMDVWAQNILVDASGALTGLIDWDRALWGDPEIEFAVLDYCGMSTRAFWEGYGMPRDDSPAARIRNVFYLLYELQKYIPIRHFRGASPATARAYQRQAMNLVARAFG